MVEQGWMTNKDDVWGEQRLQGEAYFVKKEKEKETNKNISIMWTHYITVC